MASRSSSLGFMNISPLLLAEPSQEGGQGAGHAFVRRREARPGKFADFLVRVSVKEPMDDQALLFRRKGVERPQHLLMRPAPFIELFLVDQPDLSGRAA